MRVELLVSDWCPTCPQAEAVWRRIAEERDFEFGVIDMAQPEGRQLAHRLRIRTLPALVIDGELKAVGVQTPAEARALTAAASPKAPGEVRHVGLLLSAENRWFIAAAMLYLVTAGAWLLADGSLLHEGARLPAALHLFGAGFVLAMIYGLGAHMLPRFTGNPIRGGTWTWAQHALLHAGLALFMTGFLAGIASAALGGGLMLWFSLAVFTLRLWPVLWPQLPPRA